MGSHKKKEAHKPTPSVAPAKKPAKAKPSVKQYDFTFPEATGPVPWYKQQKKMPEKKAAPVSTQINNAGNKQPMAMMPRMNLARRTAPGGPAVPPNYPFNAPLKMKLSLKK